MKKKICPDCLTPNTKESLFCRECGTDLSKSSPVQICDFCETTNDKASLFCKECGTKLSPTQSKQSQKESSSLHEDVQEIVFTPKKKSSPSLLTAILAIIGICGLLSIVYFTLVPEEDIAPQFTPPLEKEIGPQLSLIRVDEAEMVDESDSITFSGTILNDNIQPLGTLQMRLDFYRDQNSGLFETRYITVTGIPAQGAKYFQQKIFFDPPYDEWWWTSEVIQAEY